MKSYYRKFLAMLLVLIMVFSISPFASAVNEDDFEQKIANEAFAEEEAENNVTVTENPMDNVTAAEVQEETPVAQENETAAEDDASSLNTEAVCADTDNITVESYAVTFVSGFDVSVSVYNDNRTFENIIGNGAETDNLTEISETEQFVPIAVFELPAGEYRFDAVSADPEYKDISGESFSVDNCGLTINIELKKTLKYGFNGMPDEFRLSSEQLEEKADLREHNVADTIKELVPGKDYVEGQLIFLTDDDEYAHLVAEAYNADVESFEFGVAVISLRDNTVIEAMEIACSDEYNMPAVNPNYISQLEPNYYNEQKPTLKSSLKGVSVPTLLEWQNIMEILGNSADPYITNPKSSQYQWMHDVVNSYAAWGVTVGSGNLNVAVIDSGIDASHPDFSGKVTQISGFTGYGSSHGTHVAGIIAASVGNGIGGAGIAPDVKIRSYNVENAQGGLSDSKILQAINSAASNGVKVVNMSFGSYFYDSSVERAIKNAVNIYDVVFVAAAGNDDTNIKSYPAAYDVPGLICVAATDRDGTRASFSTYGPWVDVCAPGVKIYSTVPGGQYDFMSGTSQATPVVSGICALYRSIFPTATAAQVENAIKKAVNKGNSSGTGTGIVDASKLFSTDTVKPYFEVNGQYYKSGSTIPLNAQISIIPNGWVSYMSSATKIIYTTNGKNPSILNGVASDDCKEYTGPIPVSAFSEQVGKKVTIKAATVSGIGVLSKTETFSFTVGTAAPTAVSISSVPYLVSGKTIKLTGTVSPSTASQKVNWSIVSYSNVAKPTINSSGSLKATVSAGYSSGSVKVRATAGNGIYKEITILVKNVELTNKVSTNTNSLTIGIKSTYKPVKLVSAEAYDKYNNRVNTAFLWTSSNTKVAVVDQNGNITPIAKGSTTITALAQDGSNKKATIKVNVQQLVESIEITGQLSIAPGAKATYKAVCYPKDANNKNVIWSFSGSGVKTSKGASVTANNYTGNNIYVYAYSADGGASATYSTVSVRPKTTDIRLKLDTECPSHYSGAPLNKNTIWLYPVNEAGVRKSELGTCGYYVNKAKISAELVGNPQTPPIWSSSKPSVAEVISNNDGTAWVYAYKEGQTTITCKAQDGSNKSASFNVKVIVPCSSVTIIPKSECTCAYDGETLVAPGKSVTFTTSLGDAFGKPSVKKVTWSVSDSNRASISSSGKLTIKKNARPGDIITVWADTTDWTMYWSSFDVKVAETNTQLKIGTIESDERFYEKKSITLERGYLWDLYLVNIKNNLYDCLWSELNSFSISTSNPNVAGAKMVIDEDGDWMVEIWAGEKTGTATITVKDDTGTGKSVKITVKVLK